MFELSAAAELGVELSLVALERLGRYQELILEWNQRINLISRADTHRIASYHFIDSLTAVPLLPMGASVCDLGAGAGLPGIPLKIARDDVSMVLVDSIRKKAVFLERVVRELALDRTRVLNLRAEDMRGERFDVVVGRLLGPIERVVRYAEPLMNPAGVLVLYKSVTVEAELAQSQPVLDRLRLRVREVRECRFLADGKSPRRLVVIARAERQ